jgi:hypothetical protein
MLKAQIEEFKALPFYCTAISAIGTIAVDDGNRSYYSC